MRILFATGRTHPPDRVEGGAELSIHTLLDFLTEKGHQCEAVVSMRAGWRRRMARSIHFLSTGHWAGTSDWHNRYQTYRTARGLVPKLAYQRIAEFQPQLVLTQLNASSKIAALAVGAGIPTVVMIHSARLLIDGPIWRPMYRHLKLISSSAFIADRVRQRLEMQSRVVYPVIRMEDYRVARTVPKFITFINPVPEKGLELVLSAAALLPHRSFLLVEGWRLRSAPLRQLRRRLKCYPNITLIPWNSDMREVYLRTALLLVPSQGEEAFARVALEAHISGIPVIGRDIGGIGEVLRDSGTLLPQDASADAWAEAIERLLSDPSLYAARSAAASANANRPEFNPSQLVDRFIAIATELTAK